MEPGVHQDVSEMSAETTRVVLEHQHTIWRIWFPSYGLARVTCWVALRVRDDQKHLALDTRSVRVNSKDLFSGWFSRNS